MSCLNITANILLIMSVLITGCQNSDVISKTSEPKQYGVFIGEDNLNKILSSADNYEVIVIEGQQFEKEEINSLRSKCKKIYTYLNVGSIEEYRDYYDLFNSNIIGEYENWNDEYWIDVSDKSWQEFIAGKKASELKEKGFDGFFVDNCDIYYIKNTPEIYAGLLNIFEKLRAENLDIVVNGGDIFVKKLINDKKEYLIDAINQECVLTTIKDYDNDVFDKQNAEDTGYFDEYLTIAKKAGLKIYIIEYTTKKTLINEIKKYCTKNGFIYYISDSIKLEFFSRNT